MTTTPTGTATEPAAVTAVAVAFVAAVIALVVAFGVDVSDDQRDAILGVVAVGAPLVAGWLIRRKVTPTVQVVAQLDRSGEITAGDASALPTGLILEPGATVQDIAP